MATKSTPGKPAATSKNPTARPGASSRETITSAGHPVRESVLALTHVLSSQIGRAFDGELETNFGISHAEWRVILTLAAAPGATSVDIVNSWAMDKMAVSRAVAKLARNGLVRRQQNRRDRRRFTLTLTAKGSALHARVLPHANARYRELLACLSERELGDLRRGLQKLADRAMELAERPVGKGSAA